VYRTVSNATVNLSLRVASATTAVDVSESPALLDTNTSQLQTTYGSNEARDLPAAGFSKLVNGPGIYNISLNGSGVSFAGGIGYGSGPSVAGQRPDNNTFAIDRVNNDDHDVTGPLVYVSNESVSQFSILQNQFSPEFGGASRGSGLRPCRRASARREPLRQSDLREPGLQGAVTKINCFARPRSSALTLRRLWISGLRRSSLWLGRRDGRRCEWFVIIRGGFLNRPRPENHRYTPGFPCIPEPS
jgi:hypothetical protein